MKDIMKFAVKCLIAPIMLIFGAGIAGKVLGWGSKDFNSEN